MYISEVWSVCSPSLSISNTLIASSGLRERNSLAGSVWRRPRGPGERIWSGLMNCTELTKDMFPPENCTFKVKKPRLSDFSALLTRLTPRLKAWSVRNRDLERTECSLLLLQYLYPRCAVLVGYNPEAGWMTKPSSSPWVNGTINIFSGGQGGYPCVENYPRHATIAPAADLGFTDHVLEVQTCSQYIVNNVRVNKVEWRTVVQVDLERFSRSSMIGSLSKSELINVVTRCCCCCLTGAS